ncbi:unnamed protein product [Brassica oleracea var. botrytis]|uniref:(rape) hypothetical protein n=1 Tax=Brassica napus TaxID=3708 RepID=A0A816IPT6_BRANA|nr:unnamed protein product [Brassica napus]
MYQVFAQIQGYMFFSVLHVCIIEIDFGFFLLDLNLMVKALHHEVTCKNALLKAKCSEQEVKRTLWQFTPVRWDKDDRHPLQATWHVIQLELKPWNLIMSLMNLQGTTTAAGLVDGKDYEK